MKLFQRSDLLWSDTAEASGRDFGLSAKAIEDAFVEKGRGQGAVKIQRASAAYVDGTNDFESGKETSRKRIMPTGWEPR